MKEVSAGRRYRFGKVLWGLGLLAIVGLPLFGHGEAGPNKDQTRGNLQGPKLTLRMQNADVRELLQLLADQRAVSVVISDEVEGTLSVNLVDVPASRAWAQILRAAGLAERQQRGVSFVAPTAIIAQREEAALSSAQAVAALVPLQSAVIRVRYARASQLLKHLGSSQSLLSPRGEALVD